MNDLTILYYTANRISRHFANEVRTRLLWSTRCGDYPLDRYYKFPFVVVSQGKDDTRYQFYNPFLALGETLIEVGDESPSIWRVYQNILIGAKAAATPYVACCEDDTLYVPGHFNYRPPLDTFAYNHMRYVITRKADEHGRRTAFFYFRERTQMAMCIAPRELLIETLEERFRKFPEPVPHEIAKKTGWGEPGRYEKNLGLTPRKLEYFRTAYPNVTFNHGDSLMGRRQVKETDVIAQSIEPWGDANELWNSIKGED